MLNITKDIKNILKNIGENPEREGLLKTPTRVAKAMEFLTQGYNQNPKEIIGSAMFRESYNQMVKLVIFDFNNNIDLKIK